MLTLTLLLLLSCSTLLLAIVYAQLSRQITALHDEIVLFKQIVTVATPGGPQWTPDTPPVSWVGTDALQAAQEHAQVKKMAKIANAVKWR